MGVSMARPSNSVDPHRRRFLKTAAATSLTLALPGLYSCSQSPGGLGVLITNGKIYDGSAQGDWEAMDLGISNGRIRALGNLNHLKPQARKHIDARGCWVVPGFIDVHTHCDLTFLKSGWKRHLARVMPSWKGNHNYLHQGVTTVITGNCGWGYGDTDQWYTMVDQLTFGTNVGHLAPHGVLRNQVLSQYGQPHAQGLTPAQADQLRGRVALELDKGALGLSCGLEYAPGIFSPTRELAALCHTVEKQNKVFTIHMRDESGKITGPGRFGVLDAIDETLDIARGTGVSTQISHLKISSPFNGLDGRAIVDPILNAREKGLDIHADQYPYAAGSTTLAYLLPREFKGVDGVNDAARTRSGKREIQTHIKEVFTHLPPDKILITIHPADEDCEGKTLADIARIQGKSPAETYVNLTCGEEPAMAVFFGQDPEVVKAVMPRDFVITASDGWTVPKDMTHPHPRTHGTFPRKLKRFAMDDKTLDLLPALHSMTGLPATKFGLDHRGFIRPDYHADIAVIDPTTLASPATYLKPHAYARGIVHLFVNGVHTIDNGKTTGQRGGCSLRRTS